jgi:hypothetical protein
MESRRPNVRHQQPFEAVLDELLGNQTDDPRPDLPAGHPPLTDVEGSTRLLQLGPEA